MQIGAAPHEKVASAGGVDENISGKHVVDPEAGSHIRRELELNSMCSPSSVFVRHCVVAKAAQEFTVTVEDKYGAVCGRQQLVAPLRDKDFFACNCMVHRKRAQT